MPKSNLEKIREGLRKKQAAENPDLATLVRNYRERHKKPKRRETQEPPKEDRKVSDYFRAYLENNEPLANKIKIINRILWLLNGHYATEKADRSKDEKKLLEYLGIDSDHLAKILAAIGKELGNTAADEPREIIALARKIGERKNEKETWTAGQILLAKIFGFSNESLKTKESQKTAKQQMQDRLEKFDALFSRFIELRSYPEWGQLQKVLEEAHKNPSKKRADIAREYGIIEQQPNSIRFDEAVLAKLTGEPVTPVAQKEPVTPAPVRETGPNLEAIRANPSLMPYILVIEKAAKIINMTKEDYEQIGKDTIGNKYDVMSLVNLHSGRPLGTWLLINKEKDPLETLAEVYGVKTTAALEREIRLLGNSLNKKYPGLAAL
ncbi:hypothetical protein JXA05_04600 [Candidatus Peregrinibacteria bacterium]|nr:hypothetical protein [Candidatus Peregrinibacteria bacterium]